MAFIVGKNITTQNVSQTQVEYSFSYLPLVPLTKLTGWAQEGIRWENVEIATLDKGADGLVYINQKPAIYRGTINLLANSPCRNALDLCCDLLTPKWGHTFNTASLNFIETNNLTGYTYLYSEGIITSAQGGNDANRDNGQTQKTYIMSFATRVIMPF